MSVAIVTGFGGLIGSESARFFAQQGFDVIGLDNDMRAYFFGAEASTKPSGRRLAEELATPSGRSTSTSATGRASIGSLPSTGPRSSWSCTPPRSPLTIGRRASLIRTSASTRLAR